MTKNCNCLARARFGQGCRMAWPGRTQVNTHCEAFTPKGQNAYRAVAKLAAGATAARLWLPAGLTAATGPGLAGSAGCGRQQSWAGSGRPESCGCISRAGSPAGLRCPRSGLGTALADLPGMRISGAQRSGPPARPGSPRWRRLAAVAGSRRMPRVVGLAQQSRCRRHASVTHAWASMLARGPLRPPHRLQLQSEGRFDCVEQAKRLPRLRLRSVRRQVQQGTGPARHVLGHRLHPDAD